MYFCRAGEATAMPLDDPGAVVVPMGNVSVALISGVI